MKYNIRLLAQQDVRNKAYPQNTKDGFDPPPGILKILNVFSEVMNAALKQLANPVDRILAILKDTAIEVEEQAEKIVSRYNEEMKSIETKVEEQKFQIEEAKEAKQDLEETLNLEGKTFLYEYEAKVEPSNKNYWMFGILFIAIVGTEVLLGFGIFDIYKGIVSPTQNYVRIGVYVLITVVYVIVAMLPKIGDIEKFVKVSKYFIIGQLIITVGLAMWGEITPKIADDNWFVTMAIYFPIVILCAYSIFLFNFLGKQNNIDADNTKKFTEKEATISNIDPDKAEKNRLERKITDLEDTIVLLQNKKEELTIDTLAKVKNLDTEQSTLLNKVEDCYNSYLEAKAEKSNILKEVAEKIKEYKSHYLYRFNKTPERNIVSLDWPEDSDIEKYYIN